MNEVQQKILIIADEIKRICEKFSLRYYLDFGTLLGAVRHKGFIPWDDDIDFCMPRADYEKFIELCKTELKDQFALRCMNEEKYIYYYVKIDDKTTTMIEDFNSSSGYKGGIFVDIFPLDALPNGKMKRKIYILKCKYLYLRANLALVDFSSKRYPWYKRIIINVFKHSNGKKFLFKLNELLKKYDYDSAELVSSDILHNHPVSRKLFEESAHYMFEGLEFLSVKNADEYLTELFGDYMQLPPVEKRVSNHYYTLDINKSYTSTIEEEEYND